MKKPVIQRHHISYEPEVVVPIYKGEHLWITRLWWRKHISKGFIKCVKHWLALNEDKGEDL
jgi:hypothetical protein